MKRKQYSALPGFGLTMGFTLFYLSALVLIPFCGLLLRACEVPWPDFWRLATSERALAAYRITFGASAIAALANAAFGTLLAWVLVLVCGGFRLREGRVRMVCFNWGYEAVRIHNCP